MYQESIEINGITVDFYFDKQYHKGNIGNMQDYDDLPGWDYDIDSVEPRTECIHTLVSSQEAFYELLDQGDTLLLDKISGA